MGMCILEKILEKLNEEQWKYIDEYIHVPCKYIKRKSEDGSGRIIEKKRKICYNCNI